MGRFIIGQVAENVGERRRIGTRIRGAVKVKLYLPEEGQPQKEYSFPSKEVCRDDNGGVVSQSIHRCRRKHYTEVPIYLIRGGPWDRDGLQQEALAADVGTEEAPRLRVGGQRQQRDASNLRRQLRIRRGGVDSTAARTEEVYVPRAVTE